MRARILAQVVLAFLLGIVGARYQMPGLFVALAAGLAVWWNGSRRLRRAALGAAVCMAAALLGSWRWQAQQELFRSVEERLVNGETVTLIGTLSRKEENSRQTIYYIKDSYFTSSAPLSGEQSDGQSDRKSEQMKDRNSTKDTKPWYGGDGILYLEEVQGDAFAIGDTLQIRGSYREFQGARNDGNFDRRAFSHGKNLAFQVQAEELEHLVISQKAGWWELLWNRMQRLTGRWKEGLYQLRKRIQPIYEQLLPSSQAGILSVMTLGEKGLLEEEDKRLYRQAGISHMLAISGLHISLLGMGIFRLLRRGGLSYGTSGAIAGGLILCFGQLAGMEVSTSRAVLMFLVMLLGNFLGMAYDSVTALALSGLLQLWDNPAGLWYAGFQFSYAAVLAVVVVSKIGQSLLPKQEAGTEERRRRGLWGKLAAPLAGIGETMLLSSCIQLVTLPLTLWHYYEFPLYTICINSLLLPFMGMLLFLGITGGVLGLLWPGAAWTVLQPAGWLLWWNEAVCRLFQRLPNAQVIAGRPDFGAICCYYGLLGLCLYLLWRRKGLACTEWRRKGLACTGRSWMGSRGAGLILGLLPAAALVWMAMAPKPGEFQIAFLDVGQGDGIYLENNEGAGFFVDGGSSNVTGVGEYRILPFLKYHGIREITGWFVSHGDQDHISGLLEVWDSGYPIRQLFLAQGMVRDEAWQELVEAAEAHGTAVAYLSPGQRVIAGELSFRCLGPEPMEHTDRNEASLVLLADCAGVKALLTGDISQAEERRLCEAGESLQADVYKAAHHGSKHSNSRELLEAVKPGISIVSCSERNRYGHPGREAVAHMEEAGSRVYYTRDSGQLLVKGNTGSLTVQGFTKR